jgi:hypothetical protein
MISAMRTFLDYLFGCRHASRSFPVTPRVSGRRLRPEAAILTGTYVACLDCGRELPCDWAQMKIVSRREQRARLRSQYEGN